MTPLSIAAALGVWLLFSFALPALLHLKSPGRWIFFGALALLGVVAAALVLWYQRKQSGGTPEEGGAAALDPSDDLVRCLREAEAALAGAKNLGRTPKFSTLPAIFLLGPQGSVKTTSIVQSGIEPELLSGQVYVGDQVAPTGLANLWLARQSIFVEPGAAVLQEEKRWLTLVRRMKPGANSLVKSGSQAARAAVVLFDCEKLYASGSLPADARAIQTQLIEISKELGISLPVYVLFSKADRIPFFLDYVNTLDEGEATQLLGAAMALATSAAGAYEETQTARLNEAFNGIYFSLADRRLDFLGREADTSKIPGAYEFPRELFKLRSTVVRFLVDLCRPSQLSVAPFLRGFYFSGVRPVVVREAVQAPSRPPQQNYEKAAGATAMFRAGQMQPGSGGMAPEMVSRKVPQWVFLRRFFAEVVLADDAGLGESGASVKTNLLRRVLLFSAIALSTILILGWTVSYFNNRALVDAVRDASVAPAGEVPGGLASLQRLDRMRESVVTIGTYNREGAPWSYRWGLYAGENLQPQARRLYFTEFRRLLFGDVQDKLLTNLKELPAAPGPNDSDEFPYNSLKSYLITTSNHDRSTVSYLAPVLTSRWAAGREIEPERKALARKQFEFYAGELKEENPYASTNDGAAVSHARSYLAQFGGFERVYRGMLAEASKTSTGVNFNRDILNTREIVVNSYDVPAAFTKPGFAAMMTAIKRGDTGGEQWVLGDLPVASAGQTKLDGLKTRYFADYVKAWREYLSAGQVVGYTGIPDAAKKLRINVGAQSPLLAMLCLASQNTDVDDVVRKEFKPLQKVVPPSCREQYIGPTNQDYMKTLVALQVALEQIGTQKPDPADPSVMAAAGAANQAKTGVLQLTQSLGVDPNAHIEAKLQSLLEAPIKYTDPLLRGLAPAALNGKGAGLCAAMGPMTQKYPFNSASQQFANMAEINAIFKPGDGEFWKFYTENLAKALSKTGDPIPGSGVNFTDRFLNFFRHAAAFSNAAYSSGPEPKISFSLRPLASEDIQLRKVNIDGTAAEFAEGAGSKLFIWPGSAQGVTMAGTFKGGGDFTYPTYQGLWSVFQFFGEADRISGSTYEWDSKGGRNSRPNPTPSGRPLVVKFDLSMGGAPPFFQKGYFSSLRCVGEISSAK